MIYKGSIVKGSGGGSGNVDWGDIGGTLSDQTDLQTALNAKQDTLTAGSGIDITNNVISATISGLTNTATGTNSLTILGTATTAANATNIGVTSGVTGNYSTALGYGAGVTSGATRAIQIGEGTNSVSNTFSVGFGVNNYQLLNGSTGKIPNDRLNAFTGATSSVAGSVGAVPAPTTSDVNKYLKGDGTWAEAGGSVSFDGSTINENASDELQAIGVKEARTDTAIRFWHGTQTQYDNGESQTYYNWAHSNGSAVEGNWTDVTLPASANWTSVCYGNGKYVAVARGSTTAIYSTNGTSWNSATLPASASWSSVCYGNGRFVAVANGSTSAAYSTDGGETWNSATIPTSRKWRGVCYGNGKFIAVGDDGYYATSTDGGETWTEAQFYNGDDNTYYSIVYGNGKFVALANEANTSQVSTDGENWTNITLPGNKMLWVSLAFGAKGFVAVANYYKVGAYSADGETWEQITLSDTINQWTSVCYGNGKFVAVSKSTDKVAVSTDGKNWSEETVAAANKSFNTITYGGGKFVTLVTNSTEEYYKDSTAASDSVYTTDATPTTASTVYYSTTIIADLTITAVGSGTITLSDGNTYTYDSTGDQTVTYSVGELHPNYVCNIDGVGLKIGNNDIANLVSYSAFGGATGGVAGSAGLVPAPAATDNDKYLKGDGTWSAVSGGGLQNTATGTNSLTISDYNPSSYAGTINIGNYAKVLDYCSVAIGSDGDDVGYTEANAFGVAIGTAAEAGIDSVAVGGLSSATGSHSIALGAGQSSNDYEFVVGYEDRQTFQNTTYLLMDLSTGKIPNDRINGVSGSFTSQDGKTITVTNGVITSIV